MHHRVSKMCPLYSRFNQPVLVSFKALGGNNSARAVFFNTGTGSTDLMEVTVDIISENVCTSPFVYGNAISKYMLCAGDLEGGKDSCQVSIIHTALLFRGVQHAPKVTHVLFQPYYNPGGQRWTLGVPRRRPLVRGGHHQLGRWLW